MKFRRPRKPQARHRHRRLVPFLIVTAMLGLQTILGTPAMAQDLNDCAQPPALERPGDGAVGSIDPPQGNGFGGSLYDTYSYAGFVWHTYDQSMGLACTDPMAEVTTWVSNRIFDGAKLIVGAVSSLHFMLYNNGNSSNGEGLFGLDGLVKQGANAMYHGVAVPFVAFALLLVAVLIFTFALKGDLASTSKATGRVVIGLWLMSATALTPLLYTTVTDSLLVGGVKELEGNVYKEAFGDKDVPYRSILPEMLHTRIVVENWQIGAFGKSDEYSAKMTPKLLDGQAWTRDDLVTGRDADDAAEQEKHERFKRVAEDVKHNGNYAAFSGDGSSRIGASFFALVEAICFGLFQLVCKLAILLAQLILRLAIIAGPVIGLLAFAPGVARTTARAVLGILAQGLILTAAALGHAMVMGWIVEASTFGRFFAMILMAIITLILWKVLRPWHRLKGMAAATVGLTMPNRHEQRLEDLLRGQHKNGVGRRFMRMFRRTSTPPNWGHGRGNGRSEPRGWGQDGQQPRRPETVPVHEGEELTDLVVSQNRPRPRGEYINSEAWETRTPDRYNRPELSRAQAALPAAGDRAGRTDSDRDPGGDGSGGAGRSHARTETSAPDSGKAAGQPTHEPAAAVSSVPELFVPSRVDDVADRWNNAERSEIQGRHPRPADARDEDGKTVYDVYIPSTDRLERSADWSEGPETRGEN